jgi:hypothetical protein
MPMRVCRHPGLLAPLVAALLVIAPATAAGEDQELKVHVMPADTLAISVAPSIDFGILEVGQTAHVEVAMTVINTTSAGWRVTVSGADLTSPDARFSIDRANLVVTGGDTDPWGDPGVVESFSGPLGDAGSPLRIVQGAAAAYGQLALESPMARLDLTIPEGTEPLQVYRTVLVYTITTWTPGS